MERQQQLASRFPANLKEIRGSISSGRKLLKVKIASQPMPTPSSCSIIKLVAIWRRLSEPPPEATVPKSYIYSRKHAPSIHLVFNEPVGNREVETMTNHVIYESDGFRPYEGKPGQVWVA